MFKQPRKVSVLCAECGEPIDDHCFFTEMTVPEDCECGTRDWYAEVPDVCDRFEEAGAGECECGHVKECHKDKAPKISSLQLSLPLK